MDAKLVESLEKVVESRRERGLLRSLYLPSEGSIDFCSNDYLGFARSEELQESVEKEWQKRKRGALLGSTGSRLLTGNCQYALQVEERLREVHSGESALLFNSGYDLNLGLFAALPQPGDIVLYDELVHNSIRQGLRLCRARTVPFKHNSVEDLEKTLSECQESLATGGNLIVGLESVYSMDGHCAPLVEIVDVCNRFGASIVLDEAHGLGVFGRGGKGWANELGVESKIFARIYTFGKAMGYHGAVVVGPPVLREYLVNYARTLIYSTALPMHSLVCIAQAYEHCLAHAEEKQVVLRRLVRLFRLLVHKSPVLSNGENGLNGAETDQIPVHLLSPIQAVIIPGNKNAIAAADYLQARGFDVKAIRSPTVPAGLERLRVIIHAFNTEKEVKDFIHSIEMFRKGQDLLDK